MYLSILFLVLDCQIISLITIFVYPEVKTGHTGAKSEKSCWSLREILAYVSLMNQIETTGEV